MIRMFGLCRAALLVVLIGVGLFCGFARAQFAPGGDFPKAGLELWLSAAQVEQAGGQVTVLKDLSGKGNDAKRGAGPARPEANTAANPALAKDAASGQPVLRFAGSDISFDFPRLSDIRTAIWVVAKDPAAYGKRNEKFVLGDSSNSDFHAGWTNDTILNTEVAGHTSQFLHDGKSWLNGVAVDAKKTPFPKQLGVITLVSTAAVRANQVARDRKFSGRSWQGDIAEILLYNVELSDADRQAVEQYFIRKYAIKTVAAAAPAAPAPAAANAETAYVPPFDAAAAGMTPLFDGKTLQGWVGDPDGWKVVGGAIVGVKDNQMLMTAGDYENFRLTVSTIQVKEPANHQGICFWGVRPPAGTWGYGGSLDVMPPMNWMWDYGKNRAQLGTMTVSKNPEKELGVKRSQWTQAEILVNRAKRTVRMAVNGVEILNYTDPDLTRWKKGPIGLQAHGGNREVRYKDIYIENEPREDRLITLKKGAQ